MRRTAWMLGVIASLAISATATAEPALDKAINPLLANFPAQAKVAVRLVQIGAALADDVVLYDRNGKSPMLPASNMKLLTTAAAIDGLGADFKFRTLLGRKGDALVLIGDGDPTMGDSELLAASGWPITRTFDDWRAALKAKKINASSKLLFDDGIFDDVHLQPSWPREQAHLSYVPEVAGLAFNANCLNVYLAAVKRGELMNVRTEPECASLSISSTCVLGTKSAVWLSRKLGTNEIIIRGEANGSNSAPMQVTIDDPGTYAATVLRDTLLLSGYEIGAVERDQTLRAQVETLEPIAMLETELSIVLAHANKESSNLYAESLCKRLGAKVSGKPGSWENGTAAVRDFLRRAGVDLKPIVLDDGSGLSRKNAVTAESFCSTLAFMARAPGRATYFNSMAEAGKDGTLATRFKKPPRGTVLAKTGYINGVSALSGYVLAADGRRFAFSVLCNDLPGDGVTKAKQLQEQIVLALDAWAAGQP